MYRLIKIGGKLNRTISKKVFVERTEGSHIIKLGSSSLYPVMASSKECFYGLLFISSGILFF